MTTYEFLQLKEFELVQLQECDDFFLVMARHEDGILIGKFISDPKDIRKTNLILKQNDINILRFEDIEEID